MRRKLGALWKEHRPNTGHRTARVEVRVTHMPSRETQRRPDPPLVLLLRVTESHLHSCILPSAADSFITLCRVPAWKWWLFTQNCHNRRTTQFPVLHNVYEQLRKRLPRVGVAYGHARAPQFAPRG